MKQRLLSPSNCRPTDLAYLAGIIDGEGSISASKSRPCTENFRIFLAVAMCDVGPINLLAQVFGGDVKIDKRQTKTGKFVFRWTVYCRNAATVLELLLPYLIVKRDRAMNAIALQKLMRPKGIQGMGRGFRFPAAEIEERNRLATAIKSENFSTNGRIACHAAKARLQ